MTTLGVLLADTVDEPLRARFGDYTTMFASLFASGGIDQCHFNSYNVWNQQYPEDIDQCDAYVISGSRKSCYESDDWIKRLLDYIQFLHSQRKKTIGICFGHQCVALALDGCVARSERGWGVGVHEYSVVDEDTFPFLRCSPVRLQCSHQDQVTRMPRGATLTLQSEFCPYAGMKIEDHLLTVQPHPEFNAGYAECLLRTREDLLGPRFPGALESLVRQTDEIGMVRSFAAFLGL